MTQSNKTTDLDKAIIRRALDDLNHQVSKQKEAVIAKMADIYLIDTESSQFKELWDRKNNLNTSQQDLIVLEELLGLKEGNQIDVVDEKVSFSTKVKEVLKNIRKLLFKE